MRVVTLFNVLSSVPRAVSGRELALINVNQMDGWMKEWMDEVERMLIVSVSCSAPQIGFD